MFENQSPTRLQKGFVHFQPPVCWPPVDCRHETGTMMVMRFRTAVSSRYTHNTELVRQCHSARRFKFACTCVSSNRLIYLKSQRSPINLCCVHLQLGPHHGKCLTWICACVCVCICVFVCSCVCVFPAMMPCKSFVRFGFWWLPQCLSGELESNSFIRKSKRFEESGTCCSRLILKLKEV